MRLDKYLCDMGLGTRSEIKKHIRSGRVRVGDIPAKDAGMQLDGTEPVFFDGEKIDYEEKTYLMLNKPAGVITATEDTVQKTVMDIIYSGEGYMVPSDRSDIYTAAPVDPDTGSDPLISADCPVFRKDMFPVGRLDIDTEGLLLITNDGDLSHRLLSPKHHVDKTYYARLDGAVDETTVKAFEAGLDLGDFTSLPAKLKILSSADNASEALVTVTEGKFHQVKRMFSACGVEVTYLKRLTMGSLKLDDALEPGCFRRLKEEEVADLCYGQM